MRRTQLSHACVDAHLDQLLSHVCDGTGALVQRDYPVALGILVIGSLLMLIGNILSDVIYAVVDPRIRFR